MRSSRLRNNELGETPVVEWGEFLYNSRKLLSRCDRGSPDDKLALSPCFSDCKNVRLRGLFEYVVFRFASGRVRNRRL